MKPSYFGIDIDFNSISPDAHTVTTSQQDRLIQIIDRFFEENKHNLAVPPIWPKLKVSGRVQSEFHVTLVHVKQGAPGSGDSWAQDIFSQYSALTSKHVSFDTATKTKTRPVGLGITADVELTHLAWNDDLIVFQVELKHSSASPASSSVVCVNKVPHITVGTRSSNIPAVLSGEALAGKNMGSKLVKVDWNVAPVVLKDQELIAYP